MDDIDQLLHTTLTIFEEYTRLPIHWQAASELNSDMDATIDILFEDGNTRVLVQCKKHVQPYQLSQLLDVKKAHADFAVIAQTIAPKVREELRKNHIGYWDTAGNAFLHTDHHFILIEGKQKQEVVEKAKGRAFTKAGLKVVFNLLIQPDLLNATYRKLAEQTDVSLDTIHKTYQSLKKLGYLIPIDHKQVKLVNIQDLLNRWLKEYDSKLKPDLNVGNFRFVRQEDFYNWKNLNLKTPLTQWGGEPAASQITEFLRPEVLTLYSNETKSELMKNYRLVPDQQGKVQVYQKFWECSNVDSNVVPSLLIYTDLINTGDPRNRETAQHIYDQFLQNQFT